jgi:pimeloyl-ACP methyl ester carboxylesterase
VFDAAESVDDPFPVRSAMSPAPRRLPLHPSDLRGLSRLGVQGVLGLTDVVEAMHHTVLSRPGPLGLRPAGRTRGLTGFVYGAVRGTTRGVGHALDLVCRLLPAGTTPAGPQREALLAALNGVFGDHLADTGNPLAIPMQLRMGGRPWREALAAAEAPPCGRVLVLAHGLAMNDLQWNRRGHDHGRVLAHDLGVTPVYLHYNSGRHVSQNGRDFAAALDDLVAHWPVPVTELMIVGHSMGGLVARAWIRSTGGDLAARVVTIGTPHRGTFHARLGLGEGTRQMRMDSAWLQALDASEDAELRSRFTVLLSHHDNIVAPQSIQTLAGARTVEFSGIGHLSLAYDRRVWAAVDEALAWAD